MRPLAPILALAVVFSAVPHLAAGAGTGDDGIVIVRDDALTRIRIPAPGGRVAWDDVFRGIARAKGLDDDALKGLLGARTVDVTGAASRFLLVGLNLVLGPSVRFRVTASKARGAKDTFEVTLDRRAILASRRRLRKLLVEAFPAALRPERRKFGMEFDEGWEKSPAGRPLVVLIHGIDSTPERVGHILGAIREDGLLCATFRYPNDQPIADSAQLLSRELGNVAAKQPGRRVILLTHSMGGLVAREAVENPDLDPGNVERLLLVAPPSRGSVLAHFAFGLEVWEHTVRERQRRAAERLFSAIEDGLGEALEDLEPGSPFLKRLNGRPRNPRVRYSIFLGTAAPLEKENLESLRRSLRAAGERNRFVRLFGGKLDGHLSDLEEVLRGKGDGAVAVKRGRLEGVEDVVVLPFDHQALTCAPRTTGEKSLREAILQRLRESLPGPDGRRETSPRTDR